MTDCKKCANYGKRCVPAANGKCDHFEPAIRCMVCGRIIPHGHLCLSCEGQEIPRTVPRIRTNRDKLMAASNRELAEKYIRSCACCVYKYGTDECYLDNCTEGIVKWLGSEVDTT